MPSALIRSNSSRTIGKARTWGRYSSLKNSRRSSSIFLPSALDLSFGEEDRHELVAPLADLGADVLEGDVVAVPGETSSQDRAW